MRRLVLSAPAHQLDLGPTSQPRRGADKAIEARRVVDSVWRLLSGRPLRPISRCAASTG
jgi:hypothetical protein